MRTRRPRAAMDGQGTAAEPATIIVRGLAARAVIGITPEERAKRQDVLIDLTLDVLTTAGRSDRIEDAVDYKAVKDAVLRHVEGREHHLLEALAQGIADRCLRHHGVQAVEVEIDKPGALRFARSVAVRLRRERIPPIVATAGRR
jgi:D-erythro-7,8-dihydroneopterin triphosphate epimerase